MTLRELALKYAFSWLGTPYVWGGDDPSGIDCSGLVVEILQAVGLMKHNSDANAQMLFDMFRAYETHERTAGALVCYRNKAGLVVHVGMLLDSSGIVLQAAGGGASTTTVADAWRHNAFVKMRPIDYRSEDYVIVDPFYGTD